MFSRNAISDYLQFTLILLALYEIKTEQANENVGVEKHKKLDDVVIYKSKGFRKIVVLMKLREKLLFTAHEQLIILVYKNVKSYNTCLHYKKYF